MLKGLVLRHRLREFFGSIPIAAVQIVQTAAVVRLR